MNASEMLCDYLLHHGSAEDRKTIPSMLFPGALPAEFCSQDSLRNAIRATQQRSYATEGKYFRVFVDGKLSTPHGKTLLDTPIRSDETLEEWLFRGVGVPQFGLIINGFERWADSIARQILDIFGPLLRSWGVPQTSIELVLFAGNYGYTPFGVHLDDPYTSTIHFQLGPGAKIMSLWTPKEFHDAVGTVESSVDYERLLPTAETTTISPGDIYCLPPHYFHVGCTKEFSIGLAVCVCRHTPDLLRKRSIDITMANPDFIKFVKNGGQGQPIGLFNTDYLLSDWIRDSYKEMELLALSKGGLHDAAGRITPTITCDSAVKLDDAFEIKFRNNGDTIQLYARGNRFTVPYDLPIEELLQYMKHGRICSIVEIQALASEELQKAAIFDFLRSLETCRVLQIAN